MTSAILILSLVLLHGCISPAWSQDMAPDVMVVVDQVQELLTANLQGPQSLENNGGPPNGPPFPDPSTFMQNLGV
ncbi:uncharacterized protein LOC122623719 [Drosophila teissieri]|uniref:uncharacterized protein LOC122623719 n=1 Tax=Drosophila teissieri TaxID=7243 RepID=UPI001CBA2FB0|nr:uncharacterized protein LOC122623719 [Drosophila teissieri]